MREVTWSAGGHRAQAVRRPDGQWHLVLPEDNKGWAPLLDGRPAELDLLVLTTRDDLGEHTLRRLGFVATRTEQLWEIPVSGLRTDLCSPRHELLPVTACDLQAVTDLDNAVRAQIPGAEGWRGTVADLEETLTDDEFDPELYLVAVHRDSGSCDGLIRVWNRHPTPRLGCLGVRPDWRRTRLGPTLLGAVAAVLGGRGVTHVLTETDVTNRDSHTLAAHHGGVPVGRTVEWVWPAPAQEDAT